MPQPVPHRCQTLAGWLLRFARPAGVGVLLVALLAPTAQSQQKSGNTEPPAASPEATATRALASLRAWVEQKGGVLGAEVRDLDTGERLAAVNPDRALNPASAQKVVTAAVVLDVLGPAYEFQTGLYGKLEDGHVQDLVLRGHGDPSLAYSDLARLAVAVRQMGVEEVRGSVLVDQSHFDDRFVPPAFEQQPKEWAAFRAPISAISVDQNTVTLNVLATREGQPARVWYAPPGIVESSGSIATRATGSGQSIQWKLEPKGQQLTSKLAGHVPEGQSRLRFVRRMADPRLNPGRALVHALKSEGVKVKPEVKLGGAEQKNRLTYVSSAPLASVLKRMGKYSDNFYAETLFKDLSQDQEDLPASSAGGAKRVKQWLEDHKVDTKSVKIINGSGLFDANRLTAQSLTGVLGRVHANPAIRAEFVSQLAIGGVDGTLSARFRNPRYRSRVRAKTGTLNDVDVLVGYILRESGRAPIAFAILINGIRRQHATVRAKIDQAVESMVME